MVEGVHEGKSAQGSQKSYVALIELGSLRSLTNCKANSLQYLRAYRPQSYECQLLLDMVNEKVQWMAIGAVS